ncbi:hypothetical protein BKA57DRAFT_468509 [Linnemannia elongata]|nr:hypothetical protein BKA57DRAFT_468509 [Linnemannia elongata]
MSLQLHHSEMAMFTSARAEKPLLFRVLNAHEDASKDIRPRDPYATLSVDDHITKGPRSRLGSQFISTTRNPDLAVKMAIRRRSTLAVIIGPHLDEDVKLLDLSSGHSCLSLSSNNTAIQLSEVLLNPRINSNAILSYSYESFIGGCNYACICSPPCSLRYHSSHLIMQDVLDHFLSIECEYCGGVGHDISKGHPCPELDIDYACTLYEEHQCSSP